MAASATSLRIRKATAADQDRLIPHINAAFAAAEHFMASPRTDHERLAASMETGVILLAEDETGRLVASAYVELRGSNRGYVGMLAVSIDHQRSGIGRRTMLAAEDYLRARGCVAVDITVLSVRPELLPIYRAYGFVQTGTEPFHYPYPPKDGLQIHCIVMSKAL